jgi:heterodisulfide reductase subunit A-like polyferredoxin
MLTITLPEKRYTQADSLWVLPNKTDRAGVFTAGISRENLGPGDIPGDVASCVFEVVNHIRGNGAAVKEHIPVVDDEACAYCLTCVRVCPFGAMTKNPEQGAAKVIQSACQGCGVCAGECPAGAIEMRNMGMADLTKSITSLV